MHVCNYVFLQSDQLTLLQKILNEFIWRGKNKIKPQVMYAPVLQGGLGMINMKNVVHTLWTKWMEHLLKDWGGSWSSVIWDSVVSCVPEHLFSGLMAVDENDIQILIPFYQAVIQSFCFVNGLFMKKNAGLPHARNLFRTDFCPKIKRGWVWAGYNMAFDLPLQGHKIDVTQVLDMVTGSRPANYLFCCTLQQVLGGTLPCLIPGLPTMHPLLLMQSKVLLVENSSVDLCLKYWKQHLKILPLDNSEQKQIFKFMLRKCKVTKLWDVNYKILSRILATPVVIAVVMSESDMSKCTFCGDRAGLEHIVLCCTQTQHLHEFILTTFNKKWMEKMWVFGGQNIYLNPLIWICNFTIYKTHLVACHECCTLLEVSFLNECYWFAPVAKDFLAQLG